MSREDSSLAPEVVGAAGFSAPFVGLIGNEKAKNMAVLNARKFQSRTALRKAMQPGDIMLTTSRDVKSWKRLVAPVSGSPWYHAEVYTGRGRKAMAEVEGKGLDHWLNGLKHDAIAVVRERGKSPQERAAIAQKARSIVKRPYSDSGAVKAYLNETFVPKTKFFQKAVSPKTPNCEGPICSSVYTQASGRRVQGKPVTQTLAGDYLKGDRFEVVGYHGPRGLVNSRGNRLLSSPSSRLVGRAIAGLGLGATAGLSAKAVVDFKDHKAKSIATAAATGAGAGLAVGKLVKPLMEGYVKKPKHVLLKAMGIGAVGLPALTSTLGYAKEKLSG